MPRTSHRSPAEEARRDGPPHPVVRRPAEAAGERAGLLALQRSAGNRATVRHLALQRDPEPHGGRTDGDVAAPPNLGPPLPSLPSPFTFSVGQDKKGRWYWKAQNIPGVPVIDSTPEIPLNPFDIPARVREILNGDKKPGGDGKPPAGLPPVAIDSDLAVQWAASVCTREPRNPLCLLLRQAPAPQGPASGPAAPGSDLGVLWTDRVTFHKDRPGPGEAGSAALTAGGRAVLDSVLSWLKLDPRLRVRLIGTSSSEGDAEHNQQLSARRARQIQRALSAAGFGDRVGDPLLPDGQESGCVSAAPGVWSCGDAQASAEPDPEDRAVKVTFFRAPDLTLTPPPGG